MRQALSALVGDQRRLAAVRTGPRSAPPGVWSRMAPAPAASPRASRACARAAARAVSAPAPRPARSRRWPAPAGPGPPPPATAACRPGPGSPGGRSAPTHPSRNPRPGRCRGRPRTGPAVSAAGSAPKAAAGRQAPWLGRRVAERERPAAQAPWRPEALWRRPAAAREQRVDRRAARRWAAADSHPAAWACAIAAAAANAAIAPARNPFTSARARFAPFSVHSPFEISANLGAHPHPRVKRQGR